MSYCSLADINDLQVLPALETLDAVYNKIDDIHAVGRVVAKLSTLRHVRLVGNPCQVNNPPHVYEIALLLHSQLETLDRRVVTENDHRRFRTLAAEVEEEVMLQRLQEEKNKSIAEVSVFYDELCKRHRKMEEVIEQVVGANEKHVAARFDDYILHMKTIHDGVRDLECRKIITTRLIIRNLVHTCTLLATACCQYNANNYSDNCTYSCRYYYT